MEFQGVPLSRPGLQLLPFKMVFFFKFFWHEHLELQEPFTGFAKPASVLINETFLCVIFQFTAETFLSSCPFLFDVTLGSVETLQTSSKKWTRKFPALSTSRLQPPQANMSALHHNKQFGTDQMELHMYDFCLFLWLRTSELSIMLSLSSIWTRSFCWITKEELFWVSRMCKQAVIENPGRKILKLLPR